MTDPKTPKETIATGSSQAQRTPLWKRLGRRGSKTQLPPMTPPGAPIPLRSTKDEDSLEGESDHKHGTPKRGGKRNSRLMRKLKSSFRKTPTSGSAASELVNRDESDAINNESMAVGEGDRTATPSSPAYSAGSFETIEVGTVQIVASAPHGTKHIASSRIDVSYFFPIFGADRRA